MSQMGQKRPIEECCPNDCFLIQKPPLIDTNTNGRLWPISAIYAVKVSSGPKTAIPVC
jgi:hypothetical protein